MGPKKVRFYSKNFANINFVKFVLKLQDELKSIKKYQKFNATIKNSLSGPTLHNLLRTRKKRHIIVAKAREMHSTYNIGFYNGVKSFFEVKF